MATTGEREKSSLIDSLSRKAQREIKGAKGKRAACFIREFYARVALENMAEAEADQFYGAAISAWHRLEGHKPGRAQIVLFTPDAKRDG